MLLCSGLAWHLSALLGQLRSLRPPGEKAERKVSRIFFGDIIGLYWGYMGIMEKKMESIGIIGLYCILFGDTMVPSKV